MLSQLSSLARSGAIALTALASLSPAASGAPLGQLLDQPVVAGGANKVIPVEMGEGRDGMNPAYMWRYNRGPRNWDGGGRRYYSGDWHGGHGGYYGRRHYGGHYNNWGGFALGLGLGVPLGYYAGRSYDYYDPYYAPYRPRYAPRVYRGGGSAHVEWCYSRYRSYREYDNTWQPNYGRRRQCISPYS
jgi:hypothetical protein